MVVMVDPRSLLPLPGSLRNADGTLVFSTLDLEIAEWLKSDFGQDQPALDNLLALAGACINKAVREGNTCLDLSRIPAFLEGIPDFIWPDTATWEKVLNPFIPQAQASGSLPIVFEPPRHAFLQTFWRAECDIAQRIGNGTHSPFPAESCLPPEWIEQITSQGQRNAIKAPLSHPVVILNGGPGTGKTWTILRSICAILGQNPDSAIRIAAPTGKAVARVSQSIRGGIASLPISKDLQERIPTEACTIHRLLYELGSSDPDRSWIPGLPTKIDWLILDEASMIDLKLLHHLFDILPSNCRLMLVGDVHQLSSVQPGAVFADIHSALSAIPDTPGLPISITLNETFRYASDSPLHLLCEAIRSADAEALFHILKTPRPDPAVQWVAPSAADPDCTATLDAWVRRYVIPHAIADSPQEALRRLDQALCIGATHEGPRGIKRINARIHQMIRNASNASPRKAWEPVMITRNTPDMALYNGDVGIRPLSIPPLAEAGSQCWFPSFPDGLREISSSRIPESVTAHAITIHKSQGSEADHVCVILPDAPSPLLSRELLYTAASRARRSLTLIATPEAIRTAVHTPTIRHTRLFDRIKKNPRFGPSEKNDNTWNRKSHQET